MMNLLWRWKRLGMGLIPGLFLLMNPVTAATSPGPKLFGGTQPASWLIYATAPQTMCGLNFNLTEAQRDFVDPQVAELPVIGGWNGKGINLETLLTIKPDWVILTEQGRGGKHRDEVLKNAGIKSVYLPLDRLEDYPAAWMKLGEITGQDTRAKWLAESFSSRLEKWKKAVAVIPPEKRVRVYYACGADGLETAAGEAVHTLVIGYAGGRNIFDSEGMNGRRFRVSIEQVLKENPTVIVVRDRAFFRTVFHDPRWQGLDAVKKRRVYLVPGSPVCWFDRPPTFMQLLGVRWLAGILYPERFTEEFNKEAADFYRIFLRVELTPEKWKVIEKGGEVCR